MKNSTFSAQVANNLLTVLQGYSRTIRLLLVMFLTLTITTNAWAETITKEISSFSTTSGTIGDVTYTAYKGGGTSNPAVNSGAIRLYQNANGNTAGYIVLSVPDGYKITSATIKSTMKTTTGYYIASNPGATTPSKNSFEVSNYSLAANTPYTVSGLSTQYITFACFGTSSSSRLYLSYLSVTYETAGGGGADDADTWTLVKDVNDLAAGDQVVIAASGSDYALSTTQNNNNRGQAAVTKNGETITFGNDVQVLTLQTGNVNGTLAFYTGNGYLHAASSSNNYLRTETTLSNNSSWSIAITNGVATITAQGTYTRNWLRYNSSSSIFSCYSSGQGDVSIYKKGGSGGGGSTPDPDPIPVTSVSLDKTSHTMNEGETVTLTATVLPANADDPSVSWESNNEAVAKVNNGVVTAVSPGNATITVTTTDGGHTATCTITVNALLTVEGTWTLVTDASNLKAGDRIVIAAAESDFALSTTQNTNNRGQAAVTKDGNSITFTEFTQILTLEAGTVDNTLAFNTGAGYLYAASSGSNHLKTQATNNDNGSWSISIENTGVATVVAQGTNTRNLLKYNSSSSIFSCYGSGQEDVSIYKEGGGTTNYTITSTLSHVTADGGNPTTITSEAEDLTLTYSAESGWNLPDAISVTMGGNQLMLNDEYTWNKETGNVWILPANGFTGNIVVTINGWQQLAKPTGLNVASITSSGATLSWSAVANASSYTVQVYGENDEIIAEYTDLTQTTKEVSGLESDTYYIWAVTAIGDGTTYTDSDESETAEFTTSEVAPNTYTITFEANGGTRIDKITDATALPDPLPTTTRDHYTFAGWFTDEDCTHAATAGATINANTTLYAKWTPITYTVTFNAGSGTCATESTQGDFETGLELPTATPCDYASNNGWSFVGWSESSVSETTVRPAIHTGNYKPTKNITLHAVYAKTGTAQGGAGEFVLSLQYEGTTYYVGQTFDNSKLSAETNQANAALFTIEDNYLHYEGGYISHVATTSSPNITKQADKANAQAWTITEEANTIIFTSTADNTRGLGFNYNNGSPRFAAYQLSNADYPHTFTKTSVSDAAIDVTTYNSTPSCEAPVDPTWNAATINHSSIQVVCGSKTPLNAADPNGPATITFNGYDLQNSVTVTASEGFLVSTNKTEENTYKQEVAVNPYKDGQNIGKIQNVYVIAQAPAQSGNYNGTITLTGADITNGSQVINVTAAVTCTQYTITWSVNGDTEMIEPTTFYAGGEWTLPEDPTFDCNGRVFVGWTNNEIVQPQDIAPNVLYKEQGDFPTIESDITFYAVFAQEGTGDGSGTATVTDVLNRDLTGITETQYSNWSDKQDTSSAVYAGNSAGGNESIQLRSNNNNSGIITTTSGGKARKVTVVWNTNTLSGRVLNIYGKNSTYSAVTDLYGNNAGTLIGDITYGTSTTLTISDDYEYIGIRSNSGAMYLTSISIQWETDGEGDGNATTYTSYTTSCADVKAIRIVEPTTKTFNEGDKFVFDGEVWAINSDDTETNVTNSQLVHFVYDMNKVGTQTVTVSYLGFTATYEITINAVEKWQITWNVSGATNTGLSPATVVKGQTIGKLPNPKAIPDGCEGKTFVGWTESNTVNSDGTEITFITLSTVPTQNTTYYAVFATPSGNAGDGDYVKVTEDANDLSGEYLIVYEDSEGSPAAPKAFNGGLTTLDAVGNTIAVTISNNTIASTDATDAAKFTIAKNGDDYIITSASNYHIGQTSNANGLLSSTSTSYTNTITITDGNADIIGSGDAYLRYNNTSNQLRFRYYKSDTYTNQKSIALYKKSGSSASYTDYTTGCQDVTITYYGFTGGYTTNCGGSDLNVIAQRVNSEHTIPNCGNITDPTTLGRTFLNLWKDQNGKEHKPGDSFIVTENITLYAQWKLETTGDIELPADKEDLATTDIVVTGGKTLTIPEGETITINSLTLKGGLLGANSESGYAMPSVVIPDNATLVRKNTTINLDLVVNSDSWYPFAVPFAVANNGNIDYLDPVLKAASTYNTHFAIKTYDGENRAKVGTDQENNWDKVLQTAGLQPGKGYIISALTYPDKDTATIRIPMTVPNEWLTNGEQTTVNEVTRNQVTVTAHAGAAATEHQRHAGWNFVANPYLANFAGTNASGSFINGEIIINKGDYSYGGENVPYVTIPTYNFAHYYQVKLSAATLSPAYSFFIQVGESGTMTFETAGRQAAPASIAARNAEERPVKMDVDITLSDNHSSDQTGIIISDRYSEAYEIGRDLEKLFGSAYNLSVYTLMADNTPLAFQALAIRSSMQVIPVGYRTPAQGEYTFRLNEATSSIDLLNEQYEQLVLVDYQTGELTNLLIADYTFYSERTQADNRFAIYAVPRQNAPTDLPNAIGQDKQAQKILHNGHLYILRDGNVYNGNGQIVK